MTYLLFGRREFPPRGYVLAGAEFRLLGYTKRRSLSSMTVMFSYI
jgi:hypothetical protein